MAAFLTRLGVERALTARLQDAREAVQVKLASALKEFRLLNTSAARAFNRLIFPDRMRLVPLFTLCAGKSLVGRVAQVEPLVEPPGLTALDFSACNPNAEPRVQFFRCRTIRDATRCYNLHETLSTVSFQF